jgi:hypothetical protein
VLDESLHPPNTAITLPQTVEAGAFTPPAGPGRGPNVFNALPAFCRVAATLTPSSDSDIKIEVWLPAENWNGKFQAVGNAIPPWRARSRTDTRRPAPTRGMRRRGLRSQWACARTIFDLNHHVTWCTKYRYKILRGRVVERTRARSVSLGRQKADGWEKGIEDRR